ncbi:IS30 family transposase/transposase [Paeniglutamicibacter sulfureus]|uniref:IS30 family transposase/transposase n=1 Tax=Paeniglutamicibacter sulfureus TaxID=43666 RepID=A0ABU2BDT9_9MICC|nr:IS30 family transposase/transposase [Paeniglutamicibacter sulfureus]
MSSLTKKSPTDKNPSTPRKYSAEDHDRFLSVLDRTRNVSAAAAELGFNPNKCYQWARELTPGIKSSVHGARGKKKAKYTQEQKDQFFTALARLGNVSVAAREVGIPAGTCFQWAYKSGAAVKGTHAGKREEFLRLRGTGLSRREAATSVGVHVTTSKEWDAGIRKTGDRRYYPDGRVVDYKQGVTTYNPVEGSSFMAPFPGLAALEKPISDRYLSLSEREQIRDLLAVDSSMRAIARALGRPVSTVSREIRRNTGPNGYQPYAAHRAAAKRRPRPKTSKLSCEGTLRKYVGAKLLLGWSPEQISNRLRKMLPDRLEFHVCAETIYQALYFQARGGLKREVATALRTGRTRRKPRTDPEKRTSRFRDPMINISERPAEIEDRAVPGHWEGDLITGTLNQSAIATLVERTTRFVMLVHLDGDHTAATVRDGLIKSMGGLPELLRGSLTWDQGAEMATHKAFSMATDMDVYFCDPASPWQRGSNENTNGLLRQYFPKGTDLGVHGPEELERVARLLNGRPRKTLGWDTPTERLRELLLAA